WAAFPRGAWERGEKPAVASNEKCRNSACTPTRLLTAHTSEEKLAHRRFRVIFNPRCACEQGEGAPAETTRSQAHRRGGQIHRLINHADVLESQGVGERRVLPRETWQPRPKHQQHLYPRRP